MVGCVAMIWILRVNISIFWIYWEKMVSWERVLSCKMSAVYTVKLCVEKLTTMILNKICIWHCHEWNRLQCWNFAWAPYPVMDQVMDCYIFRISRCRRMTLAETCIWMKWVLSLRPEMKFTEVPQNRLIIQNIKLKICVPTDNIFLKVS